MKKTAQIIKYILCVLNLFLNTYSYSQTVQDENIPIEDFAYLGENEIKLNVGYSIIGIPEVTYERLFRNLDSAVGLAIGKSYKNINTNEFGSESKINIALTGYYRLYFGNKVSSGFFIEGNAIYYSESEVFSNRTNFEDAFDRIGIGAAIGLKLLRYDGWLIELMVGGGQVLNKINDRLTDGNFGDGYPRLAVTFGYRL